MPVNIGPKIEVDGAAKYREQINNIIQQSKTLDAQMRAVTEQYANAADSEEAVAAKSKILTQQIRLQEERMKLMRDKVEKAGEEYGQLDNKTLKWKEALANAETQTQKYSNQLNALTDDMEDLGDATQDTGSTFKDVFTAGAVLEGIKGVAGAIRDISEETAEHRKIMASLEVSSQKAGYTTEQTKESFRTLYGVLGDDQTAATTTANLQALGLAQEDLHRLINGTIGAWATYGDSIPIDGLSEAINETIRVGQVTGTFADVLNWAGTSEDAFNASLAAANSESERANLVLQELVRQGLTEAGQAWQDNNRDIVQANQNTARWQENMAELAERTAPLLNDITSGLLDVLDAGMDLIEGVDFGPLLAGLGAVAGIAATYSATTKAIELATKAQVAFNGAMETAGKVVPKVGAVIASHPVAAGVSLLVTGIGALWMALDEASLHLNEYTENALEAYDASVAQKDIAKEAAAEYWDITKAWDAQGAVMINTTERRAQLEASLQTNLQEYNRALTRQAQLQQQIAAIQAEMDAGVMGENIDKLKIANDELEEVNETVAELAPVVEDASARLDEMAGTVSTSYVSASQRRKDAILEEAKASTEAYESIYGVASDMFSRIETESEISVEEMIANLRANQEALENWAANLQELAKRGVDQGLIAELQRLGPEGAKYVAELVTATDEELAELSALWGSAGAAAAQALVDSIDAKTPAVAAGVQSLVSAAMHPDLSGASDIGKNIALGMADGMDEWQSAVARAAERLAAVAVHASRGQLEIYSPSHVFRDEIVRDGIIAGYVTAMDAGQKDVAAHAAMLAQSAVDGAESVSFAPQVFAPYTMATGALAAAGGTTNNNTRNITMTVNAADGQSAREIADEVMYRLQFEVEQEEAVWR